MNFVLSNHAKKRLLKRQIHLEWIKNTLEYPEKIITDYDDDNLVHVLRAIPERGFQILRVIYNENVKPVRIITAYFDNERTYEN